MLMYLHTLMYTRYKHIHIHRAADRSAGNNEDSMLGNKEVMKVFYVIIKTDYITDPN